MSNYSQNIGLELPTEPEHYSIQVFNKNAMVIDSELHKLNIKNQSQDELLATKELLETELLRATNKEIAIESTLQNEIIRAKAQENNLSDSITSEINRAITQEDYLNERFSTLIAEITERLNAVADSDDETLDQLSEIVTYIKNNKDLIDNITTSKVNISDIIDNLLSQETQKPLSANQGRILKELIASLTKEDVGLSNVDNKSSEDIRNDLTYDDVVRALGYNPLGQSGIGEMRFEVDENYDLILIAPDGYDPPLELGDDGNLYYLFS